MSHRRATARRLLVGLWMLGAALAAPAHAQDDSSRAAIPAYTGYVTDVAGVFNDARRAQLEGFLEQVRAKTGAQFAVLTVPTCAPEDPSAYKTRVFQAWKIGGAEKDEGLLFLIAMQEHALKFETGYGLEGTLPDGWQSRMLRDLAVPRFRAGEPAEGITAAVLATAQRIAAEKGVTLEWDGHELRYAGARGGGLPSWAVGLIFLLVFVLLPALRTGGGYSSPRPGGSGGGFGGFGGGFGGGGGGGGGSFGGFGGGSSGGGGGGSSW